MSSIQTQTLIFVNNKIKISGCNKWHPQWLFGLAYQGNFKFAYWFWKDKVAFVVGNINVHVPAIIIKNIFVRNVEDIFLKWDFLLILSSQLGVGKRV